MRQMANNEEVKRCLWNVVPISNEIFVTEIEVLCERAAWRGKGHIENL